MASSLILHNTQSSLMASSSPRTWRYRVFTSFHGPDVRKTFLSHLRQQFNYNGITMFDDQRIERGQTIAPELTQAIRDSRISIVVLSQNYASSSWCLDELLEILECKKAIGQIVMTVFYGVDPSDVRKQTGEFGRVFNETCARKTEEDRERWSQALEAVGNIAGEHFLNWDNEAEMMEKIANDVSDKLNATPSGDFDGMVGLEAHLRKMEYLLDLDNDEVKMVAITGPAGIGKTTIARALHSLLSYRFQHSCFVENLRGNYHSGFDEFGLKLRLQKHLLAEILNQDGMRIFHLGAVKEWLCDLKVLIILDDVNDIKQLEALANETTWFGPGSRIIVTTENKELLERHGINYTYHVGFPSDEKALKILCRYAFRETSPRHGYENLAKSVTWLCGNLPLGLRVVGSCLQGKNEDGWKDVIRKLQTIIDRDIEDVLRVGYESLDENEQRIFLHIVVFFNHNDGDLVKAMLADDKLSIEFYLELLEKKSLICISTNGEIVIHKLLQRVGMHAIRQEPCKSRILIDAQEICDFLENDTGSGVVSGISFDTSGINKVDVSKRALRRMRDLQFLHVYNTRNEEMEFRHCLRLPHWEAYPNKSLPLRVDIHEEMEFLPRIRLLHWNAYPNKSLPHRFCAQNLVELKMRHSQVEKLWEGTQVLTNLKKMDLSNSRHLKEIPDLSNAENLERLDLSDCESLVEIPSSIGNLHKLELLDMNGCTSLEVIPTDINLASLEQVGMMGCSRLTTFPDFSTNIKKINLKGCTALVEIPSSIGNLDKLKGLYMCGCSSLEVIPTDINLASLEVINMRQCSRLRTFPIFSTNVKIIDVSFCESLVEIPSSIGNLHKLELLDMNGCTSLEVIPTDINLASLKRLYMRECSRLRTFPDFSTKVLIIDLRHCKSLVEIPSSIGNLHELARLTMNDCSQLRPFPDFSTNIKTLYLESTTVEEVPASMEQGISSLDLSDTDIEKLPDCIHGLQELSVLDLKFCRKLTSLPELPHSLEELHADECESLERVTSPLNTPNAELYFTNCFKLSGEARRLIIQAPYLNDGFAILPGRAIPTSEFNHRARGNSLTIPLSSASSSKFKACILISPGQSQHVKEKISGSICCIILDSYNKEIYRKYVSINYEEFRTKHLCIFDGDMPKVSNEATFEFRTDSTYYEIIECGIQIMTDEPERSNQDYNDASYDFELNKVLEDSEDGVRSRSDSESENVERKKKRKIQ